MKKDSRTTLFGSDFFGALKEQANGMRNYSTVKSRRARKGGGDALPGVKISHTLRGHKGMVGRIAWSPDGRILASPSEDKTIRLWDAETGVSELRERTHFRSKVEAMDRSADRQRDFDAFVMSAKGETSTQKFHEWAGGEQVTLAIVFTDVVGSTALGEEIRDEAMNAIRRAHFVQSRKLISQFQGREIKTIGDSFMAAFKNVSAALDYALNLQGDTGHPHLQIRAGIHIGPMHVEEADVFGGTVNFAARVIGAIQGAEIWLSDRAKEDIGRLGAKKHEHLKWQMHEGIAMKGFPGTFTLWSMQAID